MNTIPTQRENEKGFHARYYIQKVVKCESTDIEDDNYKYVPVDEGSEYFSLRLDQGCKDKEHLKACRIAIHSYADAIEHHLPELAKDLKQKYPLL